MGSVAWNVKALKLPKGWRIPTSDYFINLLKNVGASSTDSDGYIMPQLDRACGLDMHKDKIVGFISGKDGSNQEFREFGTYTCELKQIRDWLQENDIHHCLMESTGIYWMSLYAILIEVGIEVIVANRLM